MGLVTALSILLSTSASASADVDFGLRTWGWSSLLAPASSPSVRRTDLSTSPRLGLTLEDSGFRLDGGYALQFSTLDVGATNSRVFDHQGSLRLRTGADSRLRGELSAAGARATTMPLTDASAVAGTGGAQVATTAAIASESLRATAKGELALDRTTLGASASGWGSRGVDARSRALLPAQRGIGLDVVATRAVTELDELGLGLSAARTDTAIPSGFATSTVETGTARWKRRLSPTTDASLAVGATVGQEEVPSRTVVSPTAELVLDHVTADVKLHAWAEVFMFVDRFTGTPSPMATGGCTGSWKPAERLSLDLSLSGGSRLDGVTSIAAADVHAAWTFRPTLSLEAGLLGRSQSDRRPDQPSFVEAGFYVALVYASGPVFGAGSR